MNILENILFLYRGICFEVFYFYYKYVILILEEKGKVFMVMYRYGVSGC